jgi:hypothetical protein
MCCYTEQKQKRVLRNELSLNVKTTCQEGHCQIAFVHGTSIILRVHFSSFITLREKLEVVISSLQQTVIPVEQRLVVLQTSYTSNSQQLQLVI